MLTKNSNKILTSNRLFAGFRNCGIINMTWTNLLYKDADQRVLPQAFEILGIGINKHKMNTTGKTEWTGITRHSRADLDAFANLADLLAHEVAIQGFKFVEMLQAIDVHDQRLWKSKVFFPNTDRNEDGQKRQISSILNKITQQIPVWDKDKVTGLFRKTAAGIANGAGADSDRVNRQLGWKGDAQSRSYAVADLEAYVDVQAMQAGFAKDSWRLQHHLGRAAIVVNELWYDVLLPGLTATSGLSIRKQEVLQVHKKLVEAYWQALPVKTLKYGMNIVAGLPKVVEVMKTYEYATFYDRVLQAECDSMDKLQMMQEIPYLASWQQANTARAKSEQIAHLANSTHADFSETRVLSSKRSAEAAETVNQEPLAKRQRIEVHAAVKEEQMQAELEQLRSHRRQKELQLQIGKEKQAIHELDQQQQDLRSRQMMCNPAQGGSALTEQVKSASTSSQDVQLSNTPFSPELQNQALLSGSNAAEDSKVPVAQPDQMRGAPKNPDFFQSQTIDGRYKEWVGGGQYASIKGQLVMNKNGLGLPRTKGICHAKSAVDNLRKKRCLPEAIEQLVMQGLTSDAAVALVSHVVADFGLRSISTQSEAFCELARFEQSLAAENSAKVTAIAAKKLCRTSRTLEEFKAAYDLARNQALVFVYFS